MAASNQFGIRSSERCPAERRRKVGFRSLQESMHTSSSGGKLILRVFGALAEFERNLIRDRTNAGLAAARGKTGGRQSKLDETPQSLAVRLYR